MFIKVFIIILIHWWLLSVLKFVLLKMEGTYTPGFCPLSMYDVHYEEEHLGYHVTLSQTDFIGKNNICGYSDLAQADIFSTMNEINVCHLKGQGGGRRTAGLPLIIKLKFPRKSQSHEKPFCHRNTIASQYSKSLQERLVTALICEDFKVGWFVFLLVFQNALCQHIEVLQDILTNNLQDCSIVLQNRAG